jgi:hypothetical protein
VGCVEFYASRILPKSEFPWSQFNSTFLSHVHEKWQTCASECTIKRLRQMPVKIIVISIEE